MGTDMFGEFIGLIIGGLVYGTLLFLPHKKMLVKAHLNPSSALYTFIPIIGPWIVYGILAFQPWPSGPEQEGQEA